MAREKPFIDFFQLGTTRKHRGFSGLPVAASKRRQALRGGCSGVFSEASALSVTDLCPHPPLFLAQFSPALS